MFLQKWSNPLTIAALLVSGSLYAASNPAVEAKNGMVVTSQHLASQVGVDILKMGGNAIDAAVAVGYAQAVVNPCCGNIGGGGFMTVHLADGTDTFINFRETAPAAASANMYLDADGKVLVKKGELLSSFAQLRDDGTTASGCWIFAGSWTPAGNQMARRDNADPSGLGNTLGWAWAWPLNRRILYNRASADPQGKPWDPKRQLLEWDGAKWVGADIPDYSTAAPGSDVGPFIMQPEGMGRLFATDKMAEGPFPEHYEPFETPLGTNPLHPNVVSNPAARVFKDDLAAMGKSDKFPYVGTTYRLTEHFHYWTKHALLNAIAQPEQFVEIGEKLAEKKGIKHGDTVKVSSNRGYIKAKAVVTKRIRTLQVHGQEVDTIGIPIHWGYEGVAKKGFIANTLTPFVGDANTQTPEFKAFLVNVEKV